MGNDVNVWTEREMMKIGVALHDKVMLCYVVDPALCSAAVHPLSESEPQWICLSLTSVAVHLFKFIAIHLHFLWSL